jgi:hypothetical protein
LPFRDSGLLDLMTVEFAQSPHLARRGLYY